MLGVWQKVRVPRLWKQHSVDARTLTLARPPWVNKISSVSIRITSDLFVQAATIMSSNKAKRGLIQCEFSVWLQTYCHLSTNEKSS